MPPIVIIGDVYDKIEAELSTPFIGPAGAELIRMLAEAGLLELSTFDRESLHEYYTKSNPTHLTTIWHNHPEFYLTNVFNLYSPRYDLESILGPKSSAIPGYPPLLKSKYIPLTLEPELDRLANEILTTNPNLIICLGNLSLLALAGQTGITKIRGTTLLSTHTVCDYKLLATYHPASILRFWSDRPTVIADFMKAKRESTHDQIRRPFREIHIDPSLEDIRNFTDTNIRGCDILSVDIETSGSRVTCIGFAPDASTSLVIPFDDPRSATGNYWPSRQDECNCWRLIKQILEDGSIRKLFQNGAYDIAFLWRAYGIKTLGASEDTMLLSHALQPESLKGLGYLGSIYSDEGSWKSMRKKESTIKRDN
jgi:uracil-DNA glycosylase